MDISTLIKSERSQHIGKKQEFLIQDNIGCSISIKQQEKMLKHLPKPSSSKEGNMFARRPTFLLLIIAATIFISELLIMIFLKQLLPLPHFKEALIDSALLSIVVFPTLYFLVFKPLSSQEDKLVEINENLESLVRERTKELFITNKNLRQEIAKKEKIEIEHNKLETQFVQIQKLEAIGLLAGGIAHDFNNLLTPILAYSEMAILELPENSKVRKNIKVIHSAGKKAAEITQQLLAFSRKQPLEIQAINLYEIVTNIGKILNRLIPDNIELNIHGIPTEWKVLADPIQIEQILMNLVVNASDAMPDGGKLDLTLTETKIVEHDDKLSKGLKKGDYISLQVIDTGIGISSENIDKIFDPFFTTKEVGKGTGLGLSTVYGIVKQQKGYIYVASELGRGTTFSLFFPKLEAKEKAFIKKVVEKTTYEHGTESILVVDDELEILVLVESLLTNFGYKVKTAKNGTEALQLVKGTDFMPDILLTDVIMPEMNGKELASKLTELVPGLKVIFMTGYATDIIAKHGILTPHTNLLAKPLTIKKLSYKIRNVLDQ